MNNNKQLKDYNQFLEKNGFIIINENYNCVVLSEYLTSIKESFEKMVVKIIRTAGYKEISTPYFVHEDLYLAEKNDAERYKAFKEPVLLYQGGHRLKKAYVLSPELNVYSSLVFKGMVHAHSELPLKVFSRIVSFNPIKLSDSFVKSFESKSYEMDCYMSNDNKLEETNRMSNIVDTIISELKLKPVIKKEGGETLYFVNSGDKLIELCKYGSCISNWANTKNLSYTGKNGEIMHPQYANCRINDSLFWYFLFFHFDGFSLRLPVKFLPYEVVILPIYTPQHRQCIDEYTSQIGAVLAKNNIRFYLDSGPRKKLGEKYNKWRRFGIPLLIEVGNNEYKNRQITIINQYSRERKTIDLQEIIEEINISTNYWE